MGRFARQDDVKIDPDHLPLFIFDGKCVFCSEGARVVHRLDRRKRMRFAFAQSETAKALYRAHGYDPLDYETNLFVDADAIHTKWATIGVLGRAVGGPWRLLSLFDLVPRFVGDPIYDFVARNRFRIFGGKERCEIADPGICGRG